MLLLDNEIYDAPEFFFFSSLDPSSNLEPVILKQALIAASASETKVISIPTQTET